MKLTDEQMRELDCWISEHVFLSAKVLKESPRRWKVRYRLDEWWSQGIGCGGFKSEKLAWEYLWYQIRHPTTNPADALAVLKKCAEKVPLVVEIGVEDGNWFVGMPDQDSTKSVMADTLETAIALFAKELFSR